MSKTALRDQALQTVHTVFFCFFLLPVFFPACFAILADLPSHSDYNWDVVALFSASRGKFS